MASKGRALHLWLGQHARLLVGLFFIAVLALGWLTAGGYGSPWDEADEMDILRMNLWEYAHQLGLEDQAFHALAAAEKTTVSQQLERPLVPISQSIERDHGQSAYYPLAGLVMDGDISPRARMNAWHRYTWLLFWLGGVGLYGCCRRLGLSRAVAALAVVMLCLSPRFFAEGHYNNKDIVLMALTLVMLWQALALMERPTVGRALAFALAGALAANTKVAGLALWGLCGLGVLVHLGLQKRLRGRVAALGALALASFALLYGLLTPALWADPVGYLGYVVSNALGFTRWDHSLLFRGAVFSTATQPLPWYYLPFMIAVTTPLWILLLLGVGQLVALRRMGCRGKKTMRVPLALCTALWLVPLAFGVGTRTLVYNGWRHFYFLYGPMLVMAAYGLHWFWAHALHRVAWRQRVWRRVATALLALCMITTGLDMALNHPYQYVYYNPLVMNRDMNRYMERDYWNVSVLGALEALANTPEAREAPQPLTIAGVDLWAQVGLERGVPLVEEQGLLQAVDGEKETPQYWLVNHTYAQLSGWQPQAGMAPLVQHSAYGQPLVTIYQSRP